MAGQTTSRTAKRRTTTKAKAKPRATAKKRTTTKAKAKPRATAKKRTTTKAKAKPRATARKRTTTKAKAKPRATAKKRTTTKAKAKPRATAKKRTTTKAKAKPRATAKKRTTTKAKAKPRATARKRTTTKAKAKPRATARKRTTTKAKAKPRATARKRTTTKAKAKPRATARKRTTTKGKMSVRKVSAKSRPVRSSNQFDLNSWLLPTLDLEQYQPHVEEEVGVVDDIKGSTRFAWIGAGQCGGRLVKSFYDLGYKKVLAVNTTHHDLDHLGIPAEQKYLMDIGEKGAGKDPSRGRDAVQQCQQEILHIARQTFGTQVDRIMVCFGAGGGTGSGSVKGLIEIAKRYARYIGLKDPNKKVGAIMTLPTVGEASSPMVAENAYEVAKDLSKMAADGKISPLIIVDNDKISKMYPGMTVRQFWPSINNTVAALFDIFNRLSSMSSRYTSFDPVDYHSIIESGGCAIMGLTKVTEFGDKFALSQAVKKNLEKTLLAGGFDLSSARLAGCIAVGGKKLIANVKGLQDNIDYAFDVLSEITGNATIHRGIYEDNKDSLRVYTIIGGLHDCTARLEDLKSRCAVGV